MSDSTGGFCCVLGEGVRGSLNEAMLVAKGGRGGCKEKQVLQIKGGEWRWGREGGARSRRGGLWVWWEGILILG